MAKVLRAAAFVVGASALIVATAGAFAPIGTATLLGGSVASTVATASAISAGLSIAAGLLTPKPDGSTGAQLTFKADPKAPLPYAIGETVVGSYLVYGTTHGGTKNPYDTLVGIISHAGPVQEITQTYIDNEPLDFGSDGLNGAAVGPLSARLWQKVQLGATPESAALATAAPAAPPDWTSAHKLSGMPAFMLTMKYDGKGDVTLVREPKVQHLGKWVKVYDARQDSTVPGGSGPCRAGDESTYVWDGIGGGIPAGRNGFVHALTWAIGRVQNGKLILGIGAPIASIDVAAFMAAANIADANGWTCDGLYTSDDDKWTVLKAMCQAGGGEPIFEGGRLSCIVRSPKVSIGTITRHDIVGRMSFPAMQTQRSRINGIIPRYRSPDHQYDQVAAGVVRRGVYVTQDGRQRTKEETYHLVQSAAGETPDQVAQLAAYDVADSREAGPIVLPMKPIWLGYRIGDVVTMDPDDTETGYAGRALMIINRGLDPDTGAATITFRTETTEKHGWALSQVGVPAPTTAVPTPPEPTGPDPLGLIVEGSGSSALVKFRYPADEFDHVKLFKRTTTDGSFPLFADATALPDEYSGGNSAWDEDTITGLSTTSGHKHGFFVVGYDESGLASDPYGPEVYTVP